MSDQVAVFKRALSTPDCDVALQVVHPAILPEPAAGNSKKNCEVAVATVRAARGFEPTASKEFGTAALVDGKINGQQQSLHWALDDQGNFKWMGTATVGHELDQDSAAGIAYERPVNALLQALRDEDCAAAFAQLEAGSRLAYGDQKKFCAKFADTFTAAPESFGSRLQADPGARATDLGTAYDLRFYGVSTEPAGYRTVIVESSRAAGAPRVLDVVPAGR